jgi:predicted permease
MALLVFDLRDALRSFRRDKAYATTVIVTLALTIGATTAVFSIVNGVLLKPLAYRESHRLVAVREIWREFADRMPTAEVNERHLDYWREHATTFDSLAQYIVRDANLTGRGEAAQIAVAHCSGSLFDVLLTPAALGRTLTPSDDPDGAPNVVTISDTFWRERLGADPQIVGHAITLDGKPYTVVGVLPPGFELPDSSSAAEAVDAFVPLRLTAGWTGDHNNQGIGRLREGVTADQARAELDVLQAQVSVIATKEAHEPVTLASVVRPLNEQVVGSARRGLLLLLAAILAVLLIACSNLANLSLTRTLGRLREAAIRSALGASRRRLIAKALLEQLVLSAAGGALGIWIAWMALGLFIRTAPIDLPRVHEVSLDARVIAFAAFVAMFAGAFVAIVPAWRIAGRDVQAALRANVTAVASDRRALRSHAALLALQIALSVALLVVTALLGTSLMRVLNVDRGFTTDRVLAVDVALPGSRYGDEPVRQAAYDRLLAAVHAVPGVQRVTTTSRLPLSGPGSIMFLAVEGSTAPRARSDIPSANFRFVAPEFFQTLGIALTQGRSFSETERDPNRPAPVVISAPAAARLWPGQDPIGKRFSRGLGREQGFEVVGVAADARVTAIDRTQPLMVYVPYWWRSRTAVSLLIKTSVDPTSLLPAVRRAVHEVDPEIAVGRSRPLEQLVDTAVAGRRYQAQLFVAFGLVALFIATVGVYAVTAYGVSRRRREMNIRVALGAQSSEVIRLILRQATLPVIAGVLTGAAAAVALGGIVASLLFEVQARDPLIVGVVMTVVMTVGLATCTIATRRGLTLDPAAALRDE